MQSRQSIRRAAMLVGLVVSFVATHGCAGLTAGVQSPPPQPAPAFNYITDEQLKSAMWQLAAGVKRVQAILARPGAISQSERVEVILVLDQMLAAADELGPDGVSSNHPRITLSFGRFRETLAIARRSVSIDPPRYYLVGNLSGTCLACHASE